MDLFANGIGELGDRIGPYRLPILLGSVSILSLGIAIFYLFRSTQNQEPIEFIMGEATTSANPDMQATITVDVGGGVVHPGVYRIPIGSRIDDAISKAGGLSEDASQELLEKALNRAQRVSDGAKIYIPKKSDEQTSHNIVTGGEVSSSNTSHNNETAETGRGFISINSSPQSELESLPGVGPSTAEKIINGRPYMNIEELVSKKAVGQKLFDKIKDQLSL